MKKSARERAEQALRHMPIMPAAKEAATIFVEAAIKSAISAALEEAAKIADRHVEIHRSFMVKPGQGDRFYLVENAAYDVANEIADAIRTLKDQKNER